MFFEQLEMSIPKRTWGGILGKHLDHHLPVSELYEPYNFQPTSFYTRKKNIFEGTLQILTGWTDALDRIPQGW